MTRVLLADNDQTWLLLAEAQLRQYLPNLDIVAISEYGEARQKMQEEQFDLIILDIRLIDDHDINDFTGIELAKSFALSTPKIITTAFPTFDNVRKALQWSNGFPAGVDLIKKDPDIHITLISAIDNAIKLRNRHLLRTEPLFPVPNSQIKCDIFIVMPFAKKFEKIYEVFKHAARKCNLVDLRIDDTFTKQDILNDIWSGINNCKLVIADCTNKNPNVFYELGLAHTLGKPVVMVTQNTDDIPFDIRSRRLIAYKNTVSGRRTLEDDIVKAVKLVLA